MKQYVTGEYPPADFAEQEQDLVIFQYLFEKKVLLLTSEESPTGYAEKGFEPTVYDTKQKAIKAAGYDDGVFEVEMKDGVVFRVIAEIQPVGYGQGEFDAKYKGYLEGEGEGTGQEEGSHTECQCGGACGGACGDTCACSGKNK